MHQGCLETPSLPIARQQRKSIAVYGKREGDDNLVILLDTNLPGVSFSKPESGIKCPLSDLPGCRSFKAGCGLPI